MARGARYTAQFSVVGTPTQVELINQISKVLVDDKAPVVRAAVNDFFGLVNDELPNGETMAEAVARGAEKVRQAYGRPAA